MTHQLKVHTGLAALLAVAALILLAPGASAHAPVTQTDAPASVGATAAASATPWWLADAAAAAAAAAPATTQSSDPAVPCVPLCRVGGSSFGMAPTATVVASGGTVTWWSVDATYHTATSGDFVLNVGYGPPQSDGNATFEIRADGLYVDDFDGDGFEMSTAAIGTSDGGYLLPYKCLFHGEPQNGAILVVPTS